MKQKKKPRNLKWHCVFNLSVDKVFQSNNKFIQKVFDEKKMFFSVKTWKTQFLHRYYVLIPFFSNGRMNETE